MKTIYLALVIIFATLTAGCADYFQDSSQHSSPDWYTLSSISLSGSETYYAAMIFKKDGTFEYLSFSIDKNSGTKETARSACGSYTISAQPSLQVLIDKPPAAAVAYNLDGENFSADLSVSSGIAPLSGTVVGFKTVRPSEFESIYSSAIETSSIVRCSN